VILSQTAIYAIRATLCLADHDPAERVTVDDIAGRLDVPRNYLSKILHVLGRAGILSSTRGPGGGFQLARPPSEVLLFEVVEHFDQLEDKPSCLLGRPECSDRNPCSAHERWRCVSKAVIEFFHCTSIADLSADRVPVPADPG
jgi:Rrf2 family iron-sulfur cluster assembly transcriptional regulator